MALNTFKCLTALYFKGLSLSAKKLRKSSALCGSATLNWTAHRMVFSLCIGFTQGRCSAVNERHIFKIRLLLPMLSVDIVCQHQQLGLFSHLSFGKRQLRQFDCSHGIKTCVMCSYIQWPTVSVAPPHQQQLVAPFNHAHTAWPTVHSICVTHSRCWYCGI